MSHNAHKNKIKACLLRQITCFRLCRVLWGWFCGELAGFQLPTGGGTVHCSGGGLEGEFVSCPRVWLCVQYSRYTSYMNFHTTAAWLHNSTSSAFSSKFIKYTYYRPSDQHKIHFQTKVHVFKTNKGRHSASIVKNCRRTITCWPILSWGWVGKPAGDSVNWKTPSAEVLSSIY